MTSHTLEINLRYFIDDVDETEARQNARLC